MIYDLRGARFLIRDFVREAPDELGQRPRGSALRHRDPGAHLEPSAPAPGVDDIGNCYAGPIEDGEQALRLLGACRTPLLDLVGPYAVRGVFQSAIDLIVVDGNPTTTGSPPTSRAPATTSST